MTKIQIMEFIDKTDNSLYSSSNSDFERVYVCVCACLDEKEIDFK